MRNFSQLDLSLEADISTRHLSFLESGRSSPGPGIIEKLARALGLDARETNTLFLTAGLPAQSARDLDLNSEENRPVADALNLILEKHRPYPAMVMDEERNLLKANAPANRILEQFTIRGRPNLLRLVFDPEGLRSAILNWEEVASFLLHQLQQDWLRYGRNSEDIINELKSLGPLPSVDFTRPTSPVLESRLKVGDQELAFVTMITTFGSPLTSAVQELLIETFFPANAETEAFCLAMDPSDF